MAGKCINPRCITPRARARGGAGYTAADDGSTVLLRAMNGLAGLLNCWLVFLCLRLLFPNQLQAEAAGLLLAAFLPPHLYLSHYVTNETLAGLFVTAAFYCYLRVLEADNSWLYVVSGSRSRSHS